MVLMSQLLKSLSPPHLEVGNIITGASEWKITFEEYKDSEHSNAYKVNFEIPWDSDSKTLLGPTGETGSAATIKIGSVTSGSNPTVNNSGDEHNAVFDFILPQGIKGERGEQGLKGERGEKGDAGPAGVDGKPALVKIGNIYYSDDGLVHISARNQTFSDRNETFLDFYFPKAIMTGGAGFDGKDGKNATVRINDVTSVGTQATVENIGDDSDVLLNINLPRGLQGEKGDIGPTGPQGPRGPKGEDGKDGKDAELPDIQIGDVMTGVAGSEAIVNVRGSKDGRSIKLDFTIPRGYDGATGEAGQSIGGNFASVKIGRVTMGDFASVVNVGTSENAILDFVLPRGEKGDTGPIGLTGDRGLKGEKGDKGDIGATGPQGPTGRAATVQIGTVTTGDKASVRNVGTETDAVLNIVLPKSASGNSGGTVSGQLSANDVLFTDGQTLQYKSDNKLIGSAVFQEGVNTQTIEAGQNASAVLTGDGTTQDPYTLNLKIPRGAVGEKGEAGLSGTVKIGNVKQLGEKVIITNSGTPEAAVLNFIFPESWGAQVNMPIVSDRKGNLVMSQANLISANANEGYIGTASNSFAGGVFNHLNVAGHSVRQKEIFTAGGTFKVPNDVNMIWVSACAGGGGGALLSGGGGGESIFRRAFNVTPGQSISIKIGAGGQGNRNSFVKQRVTTTIDHSGADGGNTIIGNLITLRGGRGGTWTSNSETYPGEAGGKGASCGSIGYLVWGFNDDESEKFFGGGTGGGTMYGIGGNGGSVQPATDSTWGKHNQPGADGVGFGSGGGGGGWVGQTTTDYQTVTAGGSGAPGIVIIEWE